MSVYPWQQKQWQEWLLNIENQRVPHAVLFYGNPGIGVGEFAQRAAQSLLCEASALEQRPCGTCKGCRLLQSETNPDYHKVESEKGVIKVDSVRAMIQFVQLARHSASYRVVYIEKAEELNRAASNALLKVLEEPPMGSVIVMSSESMPRLLPTIRSRCQKIRFPLPGPEAIAWLAEQLQCDVAVAEEKFKRYRSQVITALHSEEGDYLKFHQDFVSFLSGDTTVNQFVESWHADVSEAQLQTWLLREMHNSLRTKHALPSLDDSTQGVPAENVSPKNLERLCQLQMGRCRALGSPLNARLLMEASLLEWSRAFHGRQN